MGKWSNEDGKHKFVVVLFTFKFSLMSLYINLTSLSLLAILYFSVNCMKNYEILVQKQMGKGSNTPLIFPLQVQFDFHFKYF